MRCAASGEHIDTIAAVCDRCVMRRGWWWAIGMLELVACGRPTCPAADLECLAAAFSIVDFDHFDEPERREPLTVISAERLAAVPQAPSGALWIEAAGGSAGAGKLTFPAADEGLALVMLWNDAVGCRPGFCFSHCPRGVRCFGPSRCTPARNDGITRASTIHWVEYAKTPEATSDMDVTVVPISAPTCPGELEGLLASGVAGPPVIIEVNLPADGDDGGDDGGGICGDGLEVSTLNCTPIGRGGAERRCISSEEFTSSTGLPLPAQCAPEGTTGCMDAVRGVIVRPCCPNFTCAVGSMCGGGSTVGGVCIAQ